MGNFRARDYLFYPAAIVRGRRAAQAAERWDADRRRAATQQRLAHTLHHAVANVPYYRETLAPFRHRFDAMVADLDLSPLPLLTKNDIRSVGAALHADDAGRRRTSVSRTSGTTGTPMQFLLGGESHVAHFAGIWNMLGWTGYRFGRRFADLHATASADGPWQWHDRRLNCLRLCPHQMTPANVAAYNDRVAQFQPYFLKGTPSTLTLYARLLTERGIVPYQPPVILTCAETVYRHYRETLRRTFPQSRLFDFYNQNERACLFSTCEHGTYHIHEDYAFVELTGDDAARREIVTTSFFNPAMPLIRYQTDDLADPGGHAPCACGRSHRTVKGILGRAQDVIVTPDGQFSTSFIFLFDDLPGVRMAQIYQDDPARVEVRIVATSEFDRATSVPYLEAGMRKWLGAQIAIDFVFPDAIAPGANGKIQFIVSKPGRALIGHANLRPDTTAPARRREPVIS